MDSGNSGSMQSSSTAGDEEYDSRADPSSSSSISAFFINSNPHPPPQQTTLATHVVGPPFSSQHHVFDPLSNYLDPTQRPPQSNQILNLDMVWSKVAARSDPGLSSFVPSSSPHNNNNNNQAFLLTQLGGAGGQSQPRGGGVNNVAVFPSTTLPLESGGGLPVNEQVNSSSTNTVVRNPKKRSRASRRAPTTVLTTDTTNFRAMVQEFTGIPAPPFTSSSSSSFPRTRLDLFASSNSIASSSSSSIIREQTQTPPYLLRPFAHKVQAQLPSSIPPPSSFPPMLNNYQQHSLNMQQNPILSFQSILQPQPLIGSKTQQPSLEIPPSAVDSSHLKMGGLEELGLSNAHDGGHHQNFNMVSSSSDGALSRVTNSNMRGGPSSADWALSQAQRIDNNDGGVLRSLGGATATLNYRSNVSDPRVKVTNNNSDFHGDKGPECAVAARSEGMVESWINCSSD
ncbi:hypothetical protein AAZX31_18G017700 [Glycine max]|uniref:VQ domain-containing protein n=2 Tax=Glycine subgen. Soja TaxID=1462606 RepID=I1MYT0_SOYBN|nr:cell wall protein RBR3 [Glycine max]XP_028213880.1 cell wall protein RBR3-like [Glycine soja]KAG4934791.1 hypothetical protein JHK85_049710 [Glycine max]KAG5090315.1 hypothetical protein JHK82_049093 [Glycine max]KAG5093394.1 hypothetical protein JHK84_048982 [Glycine max]KAH1152758.1 hypothetical protein GYH30_048730 [Glycine max]KAH1196479.1 hypothetical protein GmHk_18G050490 [Glycine max]|eukprot:XP_006603093.1 cell wall protein RBR3 [Glycine max]